MFVLLFGKTYQITRTSADGELKHIYFMRGFSWDVVEQAQKDVKEKSEKEGQPWCVTEIKRV